MFLPPLVACAASCIGGSASTSLRRAVHKVSSYTPYAQDNSRTALRDTARRPLHTVTGQNLPSRDSPHRSAAAKPRRAPSIQTQSLNGSGPSVSSLKIGTDQTAVAQRGRQALMPQESPHFVEPGTAAKPARRGEMPQGMGMQSAVLRQACFRA